MRLRFLACMALAGALALGACNRHDDEDRNPEMENMDNMSENFIQTETVPEPMENVVENKAEPKPAPPPEVSDDQQMHDDADATGLTARIPDGENASAPPANQSEVAH